MAYVNVAEWNSDQVAEWLKGLDESILHYIDLFIQKNVDGKKLLQLVPDDLLSFNVKKIGHQEIILQGVELLRNIHYHLHQENLQHLALRLSSKSRSIYNELDPLFLQYNIGKTYPEECDEIFDKADSTKQDRVTTAILSGVADVLSSVKGLLSWITRTPFEGNDLYEGLKTDLIELSIRLATISQRDKFAENPSSVIRDCCYKLAEVSDRIIQEYSDPLIIQPASLDVATIKKKSEDDLGLHLLSSYHGIHQVSAVRALSPAHTCGKLQEGDELVQVNYQTVVGWDPNIITSLMQENPVEVILTVKKPPKHANTVTQIYFKPFRLPSKKRTWGSSGFSSPRCVNPCIPNIQFIKSLDRLKADHEMRSKLVSKSVASVPAQPEVQAVATPIQSSVSDLGNTSGSEIEDSDIDDDAFISDSDIGGSSPLSVRMYPPKPRVAVQRRATIPGATARPSIVFTQFLQDAHLKLSCQEAQGPSSDTNILRHDEPGERILRPYTCIGSEKSSDAKKITNTGGDKELSTKKIVFTRFELPCDSRTRKVSDDRPKLDKSHSTPAYDLDSEENIPFNTARSPSTSQCSTDTSSLLSLVQDSAASSFVSNSGDSIEKDEKISIEPESCQATNNTTNNKSSIETCKIDSAHIISVSVASKECKSPVNEVSKKSKDAYEEALQITSSIQQVTLREAHIDSPSDWRHGIIIGGNRRISCRDLGKGDHQGWLYRRRDSKGFLLSQRWEKRWFILKKYYLYGYKNEESLKADSLIYLPGFHVCPASDVKCSKKFAFKIYHSSGAAFYFACDKAEERSRWMSQMGLFAISSCSSKKRDSPPTLSGMNQSSDEAYYSETDDELEERPQSKAMSKHAFQKSLEKEGSIFYVSSHASQYCPSSLKTSTYSATTKTSGLKFLQSSKAFLSQPIPTATFRSYRRVNNKEGLRSTSTSDLYPSDSSLKIFEGNSSNQVKRKGSLRERLCHIPASLVVDRKKHAKTDLHCDKSLDMPLSVQDNYISNMFKTLDDLPHYMLPTASSKLPNTDTSQASSPKRYSGSGDRNSRERCESANSTSDSSQMSRRSSVDSMSTLSLSSKITNSGSLSSQEEYKEGSPEKLWISSLRSEKPKTRVAVSPTQANLNSTNSRKSISKYALKETLQNDCVLAEQSYNRGMQSTSQCRPEVPPRTKFLSPSERVISSSETGILSTETKSAAKLKKPLPSLQIPDNVEDDQSKTPCKPTMGVCMIGKQRKTPGSVTSPGDVFFPSPPSSPLLHPNEQSSYSVLKICVPDISSGQSEQPLHEPSLEYPPVFEPGTYSVSSPIPQECKSRIMPSNTNVHFAGSSGHISSSRFPSHHYVNIRHFAPFPRSRKGAES